MYNKEIKEIKTIFKNRLQIDVFKDPASSDIDKDLNIFLEEFEQKSMDKVPFDESVE